MVILDCPCCGVAASQIKLSLGGEAHLKRFGPGSQDVDIEGYLFQCANPRGVNYERGRHPHRCRNWSLAARGTPILEVFSSYKAHDNTHTDTRTPPCGTPARPRSRFIFPQILRGPGQRPGICGARP
jgi:sarcosine oxidase subunit delta